jgi:hypothetical protein
MLLLIFLKSLWRKYASYIEYGSVRRIALRIGIRMRWISNKEKAQKIIQKKISYTLFRTGRMIQILTVKQNFMLVLIIVKTGDEINAKP